MGERLEGIEISLAFISSCPNSPVASFGDIFGMDDWFWSAKLRGRAMGQHPSASSYLASAKRLCNELGRSSKSGSGDAYLSQPANLRLRIDRDNYSVFGVSDQATIRTEF
ncbi:hypothetical protein MCOR25_009378 [Pyricularia grisea]|nr:hypothetical protein MCOR25_009378 [Pyricularia grisea]